MAARAKSTIHATAVVHPGARIGPDCLVGPYCIVGPEVVLEAGVRLHSHVVLDGRLSLGEGVEVFPFASLGQRAQDLKYTGGTGTVLVGPRTTIREYVSIHQPTFEDGLTRVGADCAILAYCHVAHDCLVGDGVVMSNCVQLAGHVEIGDYAVLGGLAGVHQFCRVGTMSMIGACAKLVMDAVPFCLFDGVPASPKGINKVKVHRHGFTPEQIAILNQAYKLLFRSGTSASDAAARLRREFPGDKYVETLVCFVEESRRGVARPATRKYGVKLETHD